MHCECHRLRRLSGWTHLGAGCPDCRTCWSCCRCGWEPSSSAAAELHPAELLAECVAEIHATASGHHANVKARMDGWRSGDGQAVAGRAGDLDA